MRDLRLRLVLPEGVPAASEARAAARHWLWNRGCSATDIDSVELLVSELVGNAVRHAGGTITLHMWMVDRKVTVDVEDKAPGRLPEPPAIPDPEETSGRGLWLVNAFSDRWGWESVGEGKRVWFEL